MAHLLFEGTDSLKVSVLDKDELLVNISMYNDGEGAEASYLEINLTEEEIKLLSDWLDKQRYDLQDIKKEKSKVSNA